MTRTVHPTPGTEIQAEQFAEHLKKILSMFDRVESGYALTGYSGAALTATLGVGKAYISGYEVGETGDSTDALTFVASQTNHVFLKDDGNVVVNQTGVAPAGVGSIKLYEVETNGTGVTDVTPTYNTRSAFDAIVGGDAFEATGPDAYFSGFRVYLEGTQPVLEFYDTSGGGIKTRIRMESTGLNVYNVAIPGGTETLLANIRDPLAGASYIPLSQKGSANGVATLDAGALIPYTQLPGASTSAKGAVEIADSGVGGEVPQQLGDTAAVGSLAVAARADHVHKHGDRSAEAGSPTHHTMAQIAGTVSDSQHGSRGGGSLHATATSGSAGFMSAADKAKLDAATSSATPSTLVTRDANGNFSAATPTAPTHVVTMAYADSLVQGLDVKKSVRAATTANITLSGLQTVDGVALADGDRVLVKDQTTASQNGIYEARTGAWNRAPDADVSSEVTTGMFAFVEEGTTNASNGWTLVTTGTIVLGTTALTFTQSSGAGQILAGAALTKIGNQLDVAVDNSSIEISGDALRLKADGVLNTHLANMAQATIKGRATGAGTGDPTDLSASQVLDIIKTVDGAGSGLDADLLDGMGTDSAAATANTIPARDANGRIKTANGIASTDAVNIAQLGTKLQTFNYGSSLEPNPIVTGVGNSVAFHSPAVGVLWLCYMRGSTLYTKVSTDGGATWGAERTVEVNGGTTSMLVGMFTTDANTAYLCYYKSGTGTRFAKTTDGGQNWTFITLNTYNGGGMDGPRSVHVVGSNVWCVYESASQACKVSLSTNGGTSFTESTSAIASSIDHASIYAFDANTAFVAVVDSSTSTFMRVYKTTTGVNGFATNYTSPAFSLIYNGRNVCFFTVKDSNNIAVTWGGGNAGGGNQFDGLYAAVTSNGGTSWTNYSLGPDASISYCVLPGGSWGANEVLIPVQKSTKTVMLRGTSSFRHPVEDGSIGGFDSGSLQPYLAGGAYDGASFYFAARVVTDLIVIKSKAIRVDGA